jgi:hypothetical protein
MRADEPLSSQSWFVAAVNGCSVVIPEEQSALQLPQCTRASRKRVAVQFEMSVRKKREPPVKGRLLPVATRGLGYLETLYIGRIS